MLSVRKKEKYVRIFGFLKGYYVLLYCFYLIDRKVVKKLYMLYYHVYTLLSEQESKETASEKVGIKTA